MAQQRRARDTAARSPKTAARSGGERSPRKTATTPPPPKAAKTKTAKKTSARKVVKKTNEGEWYGLPLQGGGYGAALILREGGKRRIRDIILGGVPIIYPSWPTMQDVQGYKVTDMKSIIHTAATFIADKSWRLIGLHPGFTRADWPILPTENGERFFAEYDTPSLDGKSFRRSLIPDELHKYFDQWMHITRADSMEILIPELIKKGRASQWYFEVTPAHLKALEDMRPIIQKHAK